MKLDLIKYVLKSTTFDREVTVGGWIRTRRDSKGGFSFLEINDGSCLANLQAVVDSSCAGVDDLAPQVVELPLAEGDLVGAEIALAGRVHRLRLRRRNSRLTWTRARR